MRVGIDVSPLEQTRAGTARYITGLLPRLERMDDIEVHGFRFRGSSRAATVARDTVWYLARLPRAARRAGVGVLHCPTFRAPLHAPVPLVVTVHDLAVLRHPETFNRWTRLYSRTFVPRVIRTADRVISVSEFTKRELVAVLGVPGDKVRVIQNAPGGAFTPNGPSANGDYVLAVGTLEPRKNLERLFAAARRLDVEVRVVGAPGWRNVRIDTDGVRWLGEVSDADLASLYRGALCVAYPSVYEGFGIPVLEAMACGTPVVTSAGGAMEEVAGGAAVLVDPLDPASIGSGIEDAISRRAELSRAGLERAARYSWTDAAEATAEVYRELAA